MKNPQYLAMAVLAIAATLTFTSCGSTGPYPPGHQWWDGEPVRGADGRVTYVPQQTDGDELLVGQGDGEEPAGCYGEPDDGTCLSGSDQRRFAQGDPTGRYYRPLTPSGR